MIGIFSNWSWFKKRVPVFNKQVKQVCTTDQVVDKDGKSIEERLQVADGGLKIIKVYGSGDVFGIVDSEDTEQSNYIVKADVDYIKDHPGTLIAIFRINNDTEQYISVGYILPQGDQIQCINSTTYQKVTISNVAVTFVESQL